MSFTFLFFVFTINVHLFLLRYVEQTYVRVSYVWTRELALSLSLCDVTNAASRHSRVIMNLTCFNFDLPPQFQCINSSKSTDCPLPKSPAETSQ